MPTLVTSKQWSGYSVLQVLNGASQLQPNQGVRGGLIISKKLFLR